MSMSEQRKAFEVWFSDGGEYPKAVQRNQQGGYLLAQTQISWMAWQDCNRVAADAADKLIEQSMFMGWSLDGPALSRDEVNDLLDKLGAKIRAILTKETP